MIRAITLTIVLCLSIVAVNAANSIKVESTTTSAGTSDLLVRILVDNDQPLLGISFAGEFDTGLTLKNIEVGPALTDLDEYFKPIEKPDYFGVALITDFDSPYDFENNVLPPGTNQHCFSLYFDVDPGISNNTDLTINLRDGLGNPPISRVFCVDGNTVEPDLVDGTVTVVAGPVITGVNPTLGPVAGGTPITITGNNFTQDTDILIGGADLANKNVQNETTITGNIPAHSAGTVDVSVSNGFGSDTLAGGFIYAGVPTITSATPASGQGDVDVTVIGTGFTDENDTELLLDFISTTYTFVSDTELSVHIPACAPSTDKWIMIQVITSGGMATLNQGYHCTNGQPDITFKRGDTNCDNGIDLGDAITILSYLFSGGNAKCKDAFDTNDDGKLDLADAINLLTFLFASGSPPPPPFDALGTDPTNDSLDCAEQCGG